jgi:hypothetical protein
MDDVWAVLDRVGLSQTGGAFDALADPAATDALASLLAGRLQPLGLDLVVVWEGLNSAVLGYAVGLRLGITVTVLSDDEGLVSSATPVRAGTRAVLVAALTPDASIARMAASYLENQGVALVATATLLARPGDADRILTLAELPPDEPARTGLTREGADLTPSQEPRLAPRQDRR